jgi:hypothetical protein
MTLQAARWLGRERILWDCLEDGKLMVWLNQILRRVGPKTGGGMQQIAVGVDSWGNKSCDTE